MTVVRLNYTVRFLCPAFLGNAEQSGQWRTPPFKALLRQWWRAAYAADNRFSLRVQEMHAAEGRLFGAAADASSSTKSQLRLRLDHWDSGKLRAWQPQPSMTVWHPEVGENGRNVGSDLYLGYGPLDYDRAKRATVLKRNAAIQAGESAMLSIALNTSVPKEESDRVARAITLINLYGTVGGRSRNGWGSFSLTQINGAPAHSLTDAIVQRSWPDPLAFDWPHAICKDENGALVWQTQEAFSDWKAAMKRLAEIKIGLRTQPFFKFPATGNPPHKRHWLSYPVTNHAVRGWDDDHLRLPNSLRFKLRPDAPDSGRLRGIIFHVPCLPPSAFRPNRNDIISVWRHVHGFLDEPGQKLSRIAA